MCECKEVWKRIGKSWYAISSKGRVFSKHTNSCMKTYLNKDGYPSISLRTVSSGPVLIHRLVAQAFIPNPEDLPTIDHIDGVRDNNCICNLQWMTSEDNVAKGKMRKYKITSPVGEVFLISNLAKFCRDYSLCKANMTKVAKGRKAPYKGWYAEYC